MGPAPPWPLDGVDWPDAPPAIGWSRFSSTIELASGVTGWREAGSAVTAELDDVWHFGSTGKAMTSTMIAALVRAGALRWTDPLGRHLPGGRGTGYEAVTVRDLLSHRSGLPTDPSRWGVVRYVALGGDAARISRKLMRGALASRPVFPAGSDFLYSNVGYGVAGELACRVTGQSFDDLVTAHVFDAIGMSTARFGLPPQDGSAPREHLRRRKGRWTVIGHGPRAVDDLAIVRPSGCVSGRVADLVAFAQRHLAVLRGTVADDALAATHQPVGPPPDPHGAWRYAMGWFVDRSCDGGRRLWHAGSTGGCFALVALLPDADRAMAVVANGFAPSWAQPGGPVLEGLMRAGLHQDEDPP